MATDILASLACASVEPSPGGHAAFAPVDPVTTDVADTRPAGNGGASADAASAATTGTGPARPDPEIVLAGGLHRDEIIKRLRRAEGQLRGIVRMLEEGQGCLPISQQLTAVRRALDATMARIAISYLEQELAEAAGRDPEVRRAVERVGLLVGRLG